MMEMPESLGGLADRLDIELVEATPDRCVATMQVSESHHQPFGILHGGASVALAETVASVGGNVACAEDDRAFGMEINANHLRPVRFGTLTATATPRHVGKTTQVWSVEITDEDDHRICVSRCTLAVRPDPAA